MSRENRWLSVCVIIIALNMRAALTAVGPLVSLIQEELSLNAALAGILTTLPLLMFAAGAPCAQALARKVGAWTTMLFGLSLLSAGLVIRSSGGVVTLLLGVLVVGFGISMLNVLLPALIRALFPQHIGVMTSAYSTGMSIFAALGAALSVPLALQMQLGWRVALGVWLILSLSTLVVWLFQKKRVPVALFAEPTKEKTDSLFRSRDAWCLAMFMGLQSMLYYVFVAWLPTILQAKGLDLVTAGYLSSLFQMISIPSTFVIPILASRSRNRGRFVQMVSGSYVLALLILWLSRSLPVIGLGIVVCGICSGAAVSLAMSLISRRAANSARSIRLSAMVQGLGYVIASIGPYLLGKIFDASGSWQIASVSLMVIAMLLFAFSYEAGKESLI